MNLLYTSDEWAVNLAHKHYMLTSSKHKF